MSGYPCIDRNWSKKLAHTFVSQEAKNIIGKFRRINVRGDGTCFYAAFVQSLFAGNPPPDAITILRSKISDALCHNGRLRHHEHVNMIWDGGEEKYCKGLTDPSNPTLADELIINETAKLYRVNIAIFTINNHKLLLNYINRNYDRCVYLWRTESETDRTGSSDHYDALILRETPDETFYSTKSSMEIAPHLHNKMRRPVRPESYYRVSLSRLSKLFHRASHNGRNPEISVVIKGSAYERLRQQARIHH